MQKFFIITTIFNLTFSIPTFAQAGEGKINELNIYDEDGFFNSDEQGQFHYLISIKSRDSLFKSDGYKFLVNTRIGVDEYSSLKEVGEVITLDSLDHIKKTELAKFSSCKLHNLLSAQDQIFVILTEKRKNHSSGELETTYRKYPIQYTGTQKNIEMMKM